MRVAMPGLRLSLAASVIHYSILSFYRAWPARMAVDYGKSPRGDAQVRITSETIFRSK